MMSIMQCLRSFGSCLLGSLRIILFFICLVLLFLQIITLAILIFGEAQDPIKIEFTNTNRSWLSQFVETLVGLAISALGCYSSWYKHYPAMLWVTLLSTSGELKKSHDAMINKFKSLQANYDWYTAKNPKHTKNSTEYATKIWDTLQSLGCCGLTGPSDWDRYRPVDIERPLLPATCCLDGHLIKWKLCYPNSFRYEFLSTACVEKLEFIEAMMIISLVGVVFSYAFLSFVSALIYHLESNRCCQSSNEEPAMQIPTRQPQVENGKDYTRCGDSSIRHQPPVNEDYVSNSKAYPNAYDIEGRGQPSIMPPPSYLSSKQ